MGDLRSRVEQGNEQIAQTALIPGSYVDRAMQAAEVPDVQQSDVPADLDASVYIAWSRVMAEVQWIGKDSLRADKGGRYNFRGIDAILNAVGPALRKHGVTVVPVKAEPSYELMTTTGGSRMQRCQVTVSYAVFGPGGDRMGGDGFVLQALGEAFDSGDKSTPKAMSVALRTLYIEALAIPTDQPEMDPEHGPQHELAAPPEPTAEEYLAEITDRLTSIDRLRRIREEFHQRPQIAQAMVSYDGQTLPLFKVLSRVGAEQAGKA